MRSFLFGSSSSKDTSSASAAAAAPPPSVPKEARGRGINTTSKQQQQQQQQVIISPNSAAPCCHHEENCLLPFEDKPYSTLLSPEALSDSSGGGGVKLPIGCDKSSIPVEPLNLLVLQSDDYDWHSIMRYRRLKDGRSIRVVQTSWRELSVGPCSSRLGVQNKDVPTTSNIIRGLEKLGIIDSTTSSAIDTTTKTTTAGGENTGDESLTGVEKKRSRGCCCLPTKRCEIAVTVAKEWINGKPVSNAQQQQKKSANDGLVSGNNPIRFVPDFVLIREEVTAPNVRSGKNDLLGLMYGGVPSVNTLQSIFTFTEKPVVQAALNRVRNELFAGREDDFPLIPQDFFPSSRAFFYGQKFPAVIKFGTAHAGFGKVKVGHHHDMDDFRTLLPMTTDGYCTAEPFVEHSGGDYRIQKIGKHLRCYKRTDYSGAWKTNTGTAAVLAEVPLSPRFAEWCWAASKMFSLGKLKKGQSLLSAAAAKLSNDDSEEDDEDELDILTVDCIIENPKDTPPEIPPDFQTPEERAKALEKEKRAEAEGRYLSDEEKIYILEVNGTSSGLGQEPHCTNDNLLIAELVVEKMNKFYCR